MTEQYLTPLEAAAILRIGVKTLQRWRKKKRLESSRISYNKVLIPLSEVKRLIEENKK